MRLWSLTPVTHTCQGRRRVTQAPHLLQIFTCLGAPEVLGKLFRLRAVHTCARSGLRVNYVLSQSPERFSLSKNVGKCRRIHVDRFARKPSTRRRTMDSSLAYPYPYARGATSLAAARGPVTLRSFIRASISSYRGASIQA